jgi:hypothetical protein
MKTTMWDHLLILNAEMYNNALTKVVAEGKIK